MRKVIILGAAGRDFHNFNVVFRHDPAYEVVAFTASAQIPGIAGRRYPASLAGERYPGGIPIVAESELEALVRSHAATEVVFAYSDVPHEHVMHLASRALAAGADFALLGPTRTMLRARVPVIAVSAVRTGCGKSQTVRYLSRRLRERGLRTAVLRHPMPYGDLERARVQHFATLADLDSAHCTLEEREEFEPHLAAGNVVFAGVDYAAILACAEAEADLVLWDGGNNDFPFLRPDLHVALVDALRPGDEARYHPGEAVLRMADVVVAAKADVAAPADVARLIASVRSLNPVARVVRGGSPVTLEGGQALRGKRVLAIEDGPTVTHGGMAWGAAYLAATRAGAEVVDPRPYAASGISGVYAQYPHLGAVLPALGYFPAQLEALAATIEAAPVDCAIAGTPVDLARLLRLTKPVIRARYDFEDLDAPGLWAAVEEFLGKTIPSIQSMRR
jgi:predicted GTPase